MKIVILLGAPASGKGTLADRLVPAYAIPKISTGDLLRAKREDGTEIGNLIKKIQDEGGLVPFDIVMQVIEERLSSPDCTNGYILDGFPRTMEQVEAYENLRQKLGHSQAKVIYVNTPVETMRKRIVGRRSCSNTACNTIYNEEFEEMKPKKFGTCDKCGSALMRRADDNEESFTKRLAAYNEQTAPLKDHYEKLAMLFTISGGVDPNHAFESAKRVLGEPQSN